MKNFLVDILCIIFENGNSLLYKRQKDERIDNLFLHILSEPKIVCIMQREHQGHSHEIVPKDNIPGGGHFPFSSHLHAFMSSFREMSFGIYERTKQDIRKSLEEFLIVQIHTSIQTSGLKLNLNRLLPVDLMKRLLRDVVHLESNGILGLHRFLRNAHVYDTLVNHVCLFVEKASMEALHKFGASTERKQDLSIAIQEHDLKTTVTQSTENVVDEEKEELKHAEIKMEPEEIQFQVTEMYAICGHTNNFYLTLSTFFLFCKSIRLRI
ncbi:hypothetical protein RFI_09667 [Reticulomyxa filosa]|uniref:Uncharacterized protein n=1 Tax=Reticulomyxa filosa TaxID=46433 RepID=X6NP56_RETFI|nr:hypothetical protein RFI_09667 [Reticulomyxa filosa]|eukprot:ETO27464.1 hypothetical protein RFI_09667 [Reticulomyxa filosa]